jgi:hypothetical protein
VTVHTGLPLGAPPPIPPVVLTWGFLGVLPFLTCPLAGARDPAAVVLAGYGAFILSFLGGARWGLADAREAPSPRVVCLAMLPTMGGLALLKLTGVAPGLQLFGLATALAAVWAWEVWSGGLPGWYAQLRSILTAGAGAATGLCAGPAILHG